MTAERDMKKFPVKEKQGRKMEEVKISVLMSVYNPSDKTILDRAVRSIIGQTFREWEMILYDDGSEEKYISAIQKAASMDSRIRYIRGEKNMGLAQRMLQRNNKRMADFSKALRLLNL